MSAALKPGISVWIDPATKAVKIDFVPQLLQPAEYGIVLASLVVHLASLFAQDNPQATEEQVVAEILRGIQAGLTQREDMVLPQDHLH